jgi:hypothetical protein
MNNKAILLNGAKLTGKDVAIKYLKDKGIPLVVRECKDSLHKITQMLFCVSEERYWEIYNNRETKEKPLKDFQVQLSQEEGKYLEGILGYSFGSIDSDEYSFERMSKPPYFNLSVREAVIYTSEIICKPRFGADYFGRARANSVYDGDFIIDGSCGFKEELVPLIDKLGQENILLLRIHREDCTFAGDSRNLIPDGVITNTVDIYNNTSEQEYLDQVYDIVERFINA